jgi:outer membrane protein assembly factor BamE (lipoprotein component of BamABCDE complex)
MKKTILLLFTVIFITNCTLNKVENHHGSIFLEKKKDEIIVNKFNKNDVKKILGPPSTVSTFENQTWIYMENIKTSSKLLKLGKRNLIKNDILIIEFNRLGVVINKEYLTKKDINKIKFEKNITEADYSKRSIVYKMLSGLKEKINDPKGTKRIKTDN